MPEPTWSPAPSSPRPQPPAPDPRRETIAENQGAVCLGAMWFLAKGRTGAAANTQNDGCRSLRRSAGSGIRPSESERSADRLHPGGRRRRRHDRRLVLARDDVRLVAAQPVGRTVAPRREERSRRRCRRGSGTRTPSRCTQSQLNEPQLFTPAQPMLRASTFSNVAPPATRALTTDVPGAVDPHVLEVTVR